MSINIYSVANHLESEGWTLISDSYKNLNTELEMKCPAGHLQTISYGDWRKHPVCEKCLAGDPYRIKINKIPPKGIDTFRILALDAATKVTGYAIYDNNDLVFYSTFKVDEALETTNRINLVKKWLEKMIEEITPDFIGIENVQLQNFGKGNFQVELYRTLARLQGVLMDLLYEKQIPCDLAYSTQWRKYCGVGEGIGRENKKKQAQDKVALWYGKQCTQDEADAICLGKYFCHKIEQERQANWGEDI